MKRSRLSDEERSLEFSYPHGRIPSMDPQLVPVFFTNKVESKTMIHNLEEIREYVPALIGTEEYRNLQLFFCNEMSERTPFIVLIPKLPPMKEQSDQQEQERALAVRGKES